MAACLGPPDAPKFRPLWIFDPTILWPGDTGVRRSPNGATGNCEINAHRGLQTELTEIRTDLRTHGDNHGKSKT